MQVAVTFRNIDATEALREYAESKMARIGKLLRRPVEAHVVLSVEKRRHVAELLLTAKDLSLRAAEVTGDLYSAIDLAIDKLERQVKKHREKRQARKHVTPPRVEAAAPARRSRRRAPSVEAERVTVEPMSIADAMRELDGGKESVLVFRDAESGGLRVLCRERAGRYRLIEPEVD